jgi:hypothetical protein
MNWKGFGRKRSWPNWNYHPGICLELRKTTRVRIADFWAEVWTCAYRIRSRQKYYSASLKMERNFIILYGIIFRDAGIYFGVYKILLNGFTNEMHLVVDCCIVVYWRRKLEPRRNNKFRVLWDVSPCSQVVAVLRLSGVYCLHHQGNFNVTTRRYIPQDSNLHTRRH